MSDPQAAYTATLHRGDALYGSTPTYTVTAQVLEINGLKLTATMKTTTALGGNGWITRQPTLLDAGGIDLKLNFDPNGATHAQMITDFTNRTKTGWKIDFDGVTDWEFDGYVSDFEPSMDPENPLEANVTIAADGQPSLT